MILENKTEVTVPAVMAMQKAMNRQGQLARYLIAGFLLIMPIWSNKKVLKQVTQQLCNSSAPLINHYYFQPQMLKIRDEGIPDGRDLQLPYSDITRFLQDDTYFFLYVKSTNSTYILKRNAFQPNDDVQVMACLQEKLAHCKGIR